MPEDFVQVKVRYKDVDATAEDGAYEVVKSLTPEAIEKSHLDWTRTSSGPCGSRVC